MTSRTMEFVGAAVGGAVIAVYAIYDWQGAQAGTAAFGVLVSLLGLAGVLWEELRAIRAALESGQ